MNAPAFSLNQLLTHRRFTRLLAMLLLGASLISILVSYRLIANSALPSGPDPQSVMILIVMNLALLIALATLVLNRIVRLWMSLKQGSVGSRLQTRLVAMFCIVTIIPTIVVSVFSALFFNFGLQSWFNERVSTALEESVAVAEAYLAEHKEVIRADALAMATDLDHEAELLILNPTRFNSLVSAQASLRSLSEAIVFQRNRIVAQTRFSFSLAFEQLPLDALERASHGETVIMLEDEDRVRALVRLTRVPDAYLLVGRLVDSKVLHHVESATGGVAEYQRLRSNISGLQVQFSVVFILLALLLLLAAIWYGLYFAGRLILPITNLVNAAERVRAGDYSVKVAEGPRHDEIGTLSRAFNRMTGELEKQRMELIEANRQIDTRRRFSEAVLSGVSAGVIALDKGKQLALANPTAENFLQSLGHLAANSVLDVMPQLNEYLLEAERQKPKYVQGDISVQLEEKLRILHVRVTAETFGEVVEGYIVTFDDITELQIAQRNAAWADVARRVAHEIKNPLTPIQLAAERLKKKYSSQITVDQENFGKYIETISKHVGDIGKMVEEFVTFARMPAPEFKREDIGSILRKVIFSEQVAHADIQYQNQLPETPIMVSCDERQITQVFTNLLKNAAEAMETKKEGDEPGRIAISAETFSRNCKIFIRDNGPGFPPDRMQKLMEPYFTTRARGTGLGLAIVKKIVEDHHASLSLENAPEGGAIVTLIFSIDSDKNVT